MHGPRICCVCVSIDDENPEREFDGVECDERVIDRASGKNAHRPKLEETFRFVRKGDRSDPVQSASRDGDACGAMKEKGRSPHRLTAVRATSTARATIPRTACTPSGNCAVKATTSTKSDTGASQTTAAPRRTAATAQVAVRKVVAM